MPLKTWAELPTIDLLTGVFNKCTSQFRVLRMFQVLYCYLSLLFNSDLTIVLLFYNPPPFL